MNDESAQYENTIKSNKLKYISFYLDSELYGVEIHKVKEIIKIMHITPVPNSSEHVKGILNLRGKIIPVIDLRLKFGMKSKEYDDNSNIIVMEIISNLKRKLLGAIVDQVSDIIQLNENEIEKPPSFGEKTNTEAMVGVGLAEGAAIILLDIDKVLTFDELTKIAKISSEQISVNKN